MARQDRNWNKNFLDYMEMIVAHENYKGLPIHRNKDGKLNWIATAKSEIGRQRISWAEKKAAELGIKSGAGMYADLMLKIHPTKWKVCQTCGKKMSLYYHYPNATFLKSLNKNFHCNFTECDHISDIWNLLVESGVSEKDFAKFLIEKGELNLNPSTASKEEILNALEFVCRKGNKKCLGPGAMSNFPDRFDGFHTYNRCCRALQDKGRSKENLKSYTKDRRAYELWSDGNIHAANQFMGSEFFEGTSADHIGAISLGFVHDPRYLQPMPSGDNSAKRDRLQISDIEKIIETENRTSMPAMSWQSKLLWDFIKKNYKNNPEKVPGVYRDALKQNMTNYMFILKKILEECPNCGEDFLVKNFLEPNYKFFNKSYKFNSDGEIISEMPRHFTGRNENETSRYRRIAIESVFEYSKKDNRNNKIDLTDEELEILKIICEEIEIFNIPETKAKIISLVEKIEQRLIKNL